MGTHPCVKRSTWAGVSRQRAIFFWCKCSTRVRGVFHSDAQKRHARPAWARNGTPRRQRVEALTEGKAASRPSRHACMGVEGMYGRGSACPYPARHSFVAVLKVTWMGMRLAGPPVTLLTSFHQLSKASTGGSDATSSGHHAASRLGLRAEGRATHVGRPCHATQRMTKRVVVLHAVCQRSGPGGCAVTKPCRVADAAGAESSAIGAPLLAETLWSVGCCCMLLHAGRCWLPPGVPCNGAARSVYATCSTLSFMGPLCWLMLSPPCIAALSVLTFWARRVSLAVCPGSLLTW